MTFIWHLDRGDSISRDELLAVVVVADDEEEARRYASEVARDEGRAMWLDPSSEVTVRRVGAADAGIEYGVLCADHWEA